MSRPCIQCGEVFDGDPRRLLCSEVCRKSHRKAYEARWQSENRDRIAAYRNERRSDRRQWSRDFYARNRERRKALRREAYLVNAAAEQARCKAYSQANPEKIRVIGRRSRSTRRARLLSLFVEVVDPKVVYERDGGICQICRCAVATSDEWHVDHVIPIAKGGAHSYANAQLAHGTCNRSKGTKVLEGGPCRQ